MIVSTGSIDHSYDNALAQSVNDAYKTELIRERTLMSIKDLEQATICGGDMMEYQSPSHIFGVQNPATIEPEHYTLHKTKNKPTTKNANKNQPTSKQRLNNIFNVPNHAKSQ
ncbi:hypothetical protein CYJ33_04300 [Alloscardovia omnicolens]|nr:hypothetical protein CYJ33_04300 [Alloscardovia omnicolens]